MRQLFEQAANLLESGQLDWTRKKYFEYDPYGNVCSACAVGALTMVMNGGKANLNDMDEVWEVERMLTKSGCSVGELTDYNDAPGRTKEEVIARLREERDRYAHECEQVNPTGG
jgi:hypothetical protein